jgi:ketosteroid isomerase-like protein
MSQENLDIVQKLFEAVARGDIEGPFDTFGLTGSG